MAGTRTAPLLLVRRAPAVPVLLPVVGAALAVLLYASAVVLTAKDWVHEGGDLVTAEFKNPGANNAPLSVAVTGKDIVVNLATDGAGAVTTTATQVVAAINA